MKINELKPRQGKIEIEVTITDIGETRTFEKFGKPGRVCNVTASDDTGEIKLTLWNDEIDTIKIGDKVKITNGYVNEFQGEKQLTAGRFGKLEIITG